LAKWGVPETASGTPKLSGGAGQAGRQVSRCLPSINPTRQRLGCMYRVLGVTVEYLVTGKAQHPINPDIQKLVRNIEKLPKEKQYIVIQNALNLAQILLK